MSWVHITFLIKQQFWCVSRFFVIVIPAFCLPNVVQYGLILKNIVGSRYGSLEAEGPESHHVELFCSKSCSLDL